MTHINIDLIKTKIKKIKWVDGVRKHLEDIVFTDTNGEKYINWNEVEKKHLEILKTKSKSDRKEYIAKHPDWNILQRIMIEEYGHKCWYSEAPIGNGEFEIDHFRPKNRARQSEEENSTYKEDGYWWLAYNINNFRLSGTMANKRRRDRLIDNSEVGGKGDIFPLDTENGKIASDNMSLLNEQPLLLDPFEPSDTSLLFFDEDGIVFPNPLIKDELDKKRASLSINLYNLNIEQLNTKRSEVWNECSSVIEIAYQYYYESNSRELRKLVFSNCVKTINKRINNKSEFSSVARVCLNVYRKRDKYQEILSLLNL